MSDNKIQGRAKKFDGTAIDYVSIFNWVDGKCIAQVIPDASGNWQYTYSKDLQVGLTYVADGCEPITHGAYDFVGDNSPLIINGDFDENLNGWANTDGYWRWVNGVAYHPFDSTYRAITQVLSYVGNVIVTIDITVIKGGGVIFFTGKPNVSVSQGTHRVVISGYSNNSLLGVARLYPDSAELYISRVVVEAVY